VRGDLEEPFRRVLSPWKRRMILCALLLVGANTSSGCYFDDTYQVKISNQCGSSLVVVALEDIPENNSDGYALSLLRDFGHDLDPGVIYTRNIDSHYQGFIVAAGTPEDGRVWWEWVPNSNRERDFILSDSTGSCPGSSD
jgi:hypothetical protein